MSADNPLKKVHNATWTLLEARAELMALVKVGNRIKYIGSSPSPEKNEGLGTDFPEMRLLPVGMKPHLQETSTTSKLIVVWQIQIASGDQRLQELLDIEWELYRALKTWSTHLREALTWQGKEFVTLARPLETKIVLGNKEADRGIRGWSAVWTGETQLNFTTSDL